MRGEVLTVHIDLVVVGSGGGGEVLTVHTDLVVGVGGEVLTVNIDLVGWW